MTCTCTVRLDSKHLRAIIRLEFACYKVFTPYPTCPQQITFIRFSISLPLHICCKGPESHRDEGNQVPPAPLSTRPVMKCREADARLSVGTEQGSCFCKMMCVNLSLTRRV